MSKIIVTHIRPDMDVCCSVWLVKRYFPGFSKAEVEFVPAGNTYENKPVDTDKNIIHVDTGLGKFDHHQFRERNSAANILFQHLYKNKLIPSKDIGALERLVELITMIDNFEEVDYNEPTSDVYELGIEQILEGIKMQEKNDHVVLDFVLTAIDGLFNILNKKIRAEKEIKDGEIFTVRKIKCLTVQSNSKETSKLAEKSGFQLIIIKDPEKGNINIRVHPRAKFNLDKVFQKISEHEGKDKWFYHISGHLLLNGSSSHPQPPTSLSLSQVVEIVKNNI